jgi:hypothetical protein
MSKFSFLIHTLPGSDQPAARLAALVERIESQLDGAQMFRLNPRLALPVESLNIDERGEVVRGNEDGYWRLGSHIRWLESQVRQSENPVGKPKKIEGLPTDPTERLAELRDRIETADGKRMFRMPGDRLIPVESTYIDNAGYVDGVFFVGAFSLARHLGWLEDKAGPAPKVVLPPPQKIEGLSVDPFERLSALQDRIETTDSERMFRMPDRLLVPVGSTYIDNAGFVDEHLFAGAYLLERHLEWLGQQPRAIDIPGFDRLVERYCALKARITENEFELGGRRVPVGDIWINESGKVSLQRFFQSWPLEDHIKWLENKRVVADHIRRTSRERSDRVRAELAGQVDNAPRVSTISRRGEPIVKLVDDRPRSRSYGRTSEAW